MSIDDAKVETILTKAADVYFGDKQMWDTIETVMNQCAKASEGLLSIDGNEPRRIADTAKAFLEATWEYVTVRTKAEKRLNMFRSVLLFVYVDCGEEWCRLWINSYTDEDDIKSLLISYVDYLATQKPDDIQACYNSNPDIAKIKSSLIKNEEEEIKQ